MVGERREEKQNKTVVISLSDARYPRIVVVLQSVTHKKKNPEDVEPLFKNTFVILLAYSCVLSGKVSHCIEPTS